jgi:8-amino-7-oxononanoate synthase
MTQSHSAPACAAEKVEDAFITNNFSERRRAMAEIFQQSPMFDVELKRVHKRQLEDKNGHRLFDFATQDYLGFDFEPDVVNAAVEGTKQFGTVIAWCRMVATMDVFNEAERQIAELVGTEACSIFASTTLLNHGVIPALLGNDGILFLDKSAHATMYEGAKIARDSGAKLASFPSDDLVKLRSLLEQNKDNPKKLIAVDGVNSMTGGYTDLPGLDALAKEFGALLFVDDAHGFGVVGEHPDAQLYPYGRKGNGLVKYFGLDYDNIVYVGCFSKAYGSFGSFIACSKRMRSFLLSQATPHDLGGAGPASAMSALLAGLKINALDGDNRRNRTWKLTQKALDGIGALGFSTHNATGFPIVSVRLAAGHLMVEVSKILYEHNILATLAPYPSVKKGDEAIRLTFTASNTDEEVDALIQAFMRVKEFLIAQGADIQ